MGPLEALSRVPFSLPSRVFPLSLRVQCSCLQMCLG